MMKGREATNTTLVERAVISEAAYIGENAV